MAASVGRDGRVCGIDISEDMLAMSRKRCADQPWTEFQRADATNLSFGQENPGGKSHEDKSLVRSIQSPLSDEPGKAM